MMKFGAIVLAAGKGSRFGEKKQFLTFQGKQLWKIVYDKAVPIVGDNIIVVGIDVEGGATRSESVRIGLNNLDSDTDRVIILESARPLVTESQIEELLNSNDPSVSFVMPLVNTVIYRDGTYINRNDLYELLTPQAFDYKKLVEAYSSYEKLDLTDETYLMFQVYGIKPKFIVTGQNLFKITYKRDVEILQQLNKLMTNGELK